LRKEAVQRRTIAAFEGPTHAADHWWQDALHLEKGIQAWFVVDPPDGKVPPLTAEGQKRVAVRTEARRSSAVNGHPDNPRDLVYSPLNRKSLTTILTDFKPMPAFKLGEPTANFDVILGRTAEQIEDGTLKSVAKPRA
jgi:hypothetical protein